MWVEQPPIEISRTWRKKIATELFPSLNSSEFGFQTNQTD